MASLVKQSRLLWHLEVLLAVLLVMAAFGVAGVADACFGSDAWSPFMGLAVCGLVVGALIANAAMDRLRDAHVRWAQMSMDLAWRGMKRAGSGFVRHVPWPDTGQSAASPDVAPDLVPDFAPDLANEVERMAAQARSQAGEMQAATSSTQEILAGIEQVTSRLAAAGEQAARMARECGSMPGPGVVTMGEELAGLSGTIGEAALQLKALHELAGLTKAAA